MALEPSTDPLMRAVTAARAQPTPGWVDISETIMSKVHALVTPADPILVFTDDGTPRRDEAAGTTFLSARVLTAALRRLLQRQPTHSPETIGLHVEDDILLGIDLELVCAYGPHLPDLATGIRADVLAETRRLLGNVPAVAASAVNIIFTDVVRGDPNHD